MMQARLLLICHPFTMDINIYQGPN